MKKELIAFIELCLADGKISDKERKVIIKKSIDLGVDIDECEILIDSLTQKHSSSLKGKLSVKETKRNYKPIVVKSVKPAKLDKEAEFTKLIGELDNEINVVFEKKNRAIADLVSSNKIIKEKRDVLKNELEALSKEINIELKDFVDTYFKSVEDMLSIKFGSTSIVLKDGVEKYDHSNLNNINKFIINNALWDNSKIQKRNALLGVILYGLAVGVFFSSLVFFNLKGEDLPLIFHILVALLTVAGYYFRKKRNINTMNSTNADVEASIEEVHQKNKKQIDQIVLKKKLLKRGYKTMDYKLTTF